MPSVHLPPWIARQAAELLARPGHAWLLQGPSGLGQFELALALAAAWLCDAPTPQGACGQCPGCHSLHVHTHADFVMLMPETHMLERGWPLPEKAQAEIDEKKRKPSKEIRVDAMRDAIEFAQRTSARGRGKAMLIYPAERMNAVTANALLKTLEEPPGDMRFVLATEAAHLLLPTIRSRCLTHTLRWPDAAEALPWLAAGGVQEAAAAALLQAAGGRPAAALQLARSAESQAEARTTARKAKPAFDDGQQAAAAWARLPKALAQGDASALASLPTAEIVARLQKLCADLMAAQTGAPPRFFAAADLPARPLPLPALAKWWGQLAQAARSAEHPLNAGLTLEYLASSARQALNSAKATN